MKLDKNKVYSLEELTSEERNKLSVILGFNILKYSFLYYGSEKGWYCTNYSSSKAINLHNAKELFYTLENVQVDCSDLSDEQIKEMADVFENNGYKQWTDLDAFKIECNFTYLRLDYVNEFYITGDLDTKTTITYEKFMELFGENEKLPPYKEAPLKWNYETLVGGNQVVIEHTKEFIPSKKQVLKYLLKRDIVLTPKQYKKLWKK